MQNLIRGISGKNLGPTGDFSAFAYFTRAQHPFGNGFGFFFDPSRYLFLTDERGVQGLCAHVRFIGFDINGIDLGIKIFQQMTGVFQRLLRFLAFINGYQDFHCYHLFFCGYLNTRTEDWQTPTNLSTQSLGNSRVSKDFFPIQNASRSWLVSVEITASNLDSSASRVFTGIPLSL